MAKMKVEICTGGRPEMKVKVRAVRRPKRVDSTFASYYDVSAKTPGEAIDEVLEKELDSSLSEPISFIQLDFPR